MRALWFSGGKDSMACLYLLKEELKDIYVLFCDTGKSYPELLETVSKASKLCPNFEIVYSDRNGQWERNGFPADVVPINWTVLGQSITSKKPYFIQDYLQCCYANLAAPLYKRTGELGISTIIRGQRADETYKSTLRDGDFFDGFTIEQPIESWSKEEVFEFLKKEMGELPEHYTLEHSSMDCYDCTAYQDVSKDRIEFTRKKYPLFYAEYKANMEKIKFAINQAGSCLG